MNAFCWIQGTFTIPSQLTGQNYVIDGVSAPTGGEMPNKVITSKDSTDEMHHAWYQRACFVLFIQALMCYAPYYLWKSIEGGKMPAIIQGLQKPMIIHENE